MRNAEKLATAEASHLNVKNEFSLRVQALITERWDFANAPLLQLLDFQQNFYANMNSAVSPFAACASTARASPQLPPAIWRRVQQRRLMPPPIHRYTFEGALLDAEARQVARQTISAQALAEAVAPKPIAAYLPQSMSAASSASPQGASPGAPFGAPPGAPPGGPPAPYGPPPGGPPPGGPPPGGPPVPSPVGRPAGYPPPPPGGPPPAAGGPPGGAAASLYGGAYGVPVPMPARGSSGEGVPPPPAGRPPPPPGRPPPPPAPPPPPPAQKGERLRALGDYTATDPRMISFSAGEVMLKEREEGGWFFGSNSRGDQGFFPANYVERT